MPRRGRATAKVPPRGAPRPDRPATSDLEPAPPAHQPDSECSRYGPFAVCTISTNAWLRVQPRSAISTPSAVSRIRAPARRGSCDRPDASNSHSPPMAYVSPITHDITYDIQYIFPQPLPIALRAGSTITATVDVQHASCRGLDGCGSIGRELRRTAARSSSVALGRSMTLRSSTAA